jgi:hypothetical protein
MSVHKVIVVLIGFLVIKCAGYLSEFPASV